MSEEIGGSDEIAVLDQQFNRMLGKLDQLIKTSYVQKLENKEAQLKNLQLQINPHFLYNTLETISSIAAVKQVFVVCDICGKLGKSSGTVWEKDYGEMVPLEQEMKHIKTICLSRRSVTETGCRYFIILMWTRRMYIFRGLFYSQSLKMQSHMALGI